MKMKLFLKSITLNNCIFLLLLILPTSCIKEKFDNRKFDGLLNLRPGVAVPVGYSHLGLEKYLKDAILRNEVRVSQDGFLSLFYTTNVASGTMGDLLSLQNSGIAKTISNQSASVINLQTPGTSLDLEDSISLPVRLAQTDARIDSISLLSGTFQISQSSSNLTGTITYTFPGLIVNGIPFTITRNISDPGLTLPLSGYRIIPEHDPGGNNLLKCIVSVHLEAPSGPVNIGSAVLSTDLIMNSVNYNTIYGDFGGYNIDLSEFGFRTGILKQIITGQFEFADPKLKLLFYNSAGVPLSLSFSQLEAVDRNNTPHILTGSGIPDVSNPKIINYPSLIQVGQTVKDSIQFDRTNSNLREILSANTDSIRIKAEAKIISPPGAGTSFISHNSEYSVMADIELPLWGKASFIILLDTISFNYLNTSLPAPDKLERLIVHLNITNSFPVAVYPQIYMLDANRILIDSLITGEQMIEGASDINNDGVTDPHIQDPIDIDLSGARIDLLYKTRYLVTRGKIFTTDFPDKDVKFYLSYFLDYKVGLISQLKINTGN